MVWRGVYYWGIGYEGISKQTLLHFLMVAMTGDNNSCLDRRSKYNRMSSKHSPITSWDYNKGSRSVNAWPCQRDNQVLSQQGTGRRTTPQAEDRYRGDQSDLREYDQRVRRRFQQSYEQSSKETIDEQQSTLAEAHSHPIDAKAQRYLMEQYGERLKLEIVTLKQAISRKESEYLESERKFFAERQRIQAFIKDRVSQIEDLKGRKVKTTKERQDRIMKRRLKVRELSCVNLPLPISMSINQEVQTDRQKEDNRNAETQTQNEKKSALEAEEHIDPAKQTVTSEQKSKGSFSSAASTQALEIQQNKANSYRRVQLPFMNVPKVVMESTAYVHNPKRLSFFHGDVLLDEADCREFLSEQLERAKGSTIKHTRMVYRYDPKNKANVHLYADGCADLLFLGCTVNGYLLAAYSELALAQRMAVGGCAFLASLTNRKVFPLAAGKKAMTYDPIFLIFGNSEVRVSADRPEIFSNFGVGSGVYVARGERVDCLLGEGQTREIALANYELHQIIYQ